MFVASNWQVNRLREIPYPLRSLLRLNASLAARPVVRWFVRCLTQNTVRCGIARAGLMTGLATAETKVTAVDL